MRDLVIKRVIELIEVVGIDILTEAELHILPDTSLLSIYENLVLEANSPEEDSWNSWGLDDDHLDSDSWT
jgi:hypothetical protein